MSVQAKLISLGTVSVAMLGIFALIIHTDDSVVQQTVGTSTEQPLSVVASFYPVYYFAQQVGGEYAQVTNITPAGAEPHDYEPSPADIVAIENSRLLVLNGGEVDVWGGRVQQDLDPNKTTVVVAGEGLMTRQIEDEEDPREMIADPHVWLSPVLAQQMVDKIAAGFVHVDPKNASHYRANAEALQARLGELNTDFEQGLHTCTSKDIVTSHAAFSYLAATYGLNQVPISGISPDQEPSAQELTQVANFAKEHNITYIFFESLVSPKLSETIAQEVGAETLVLNPLEGLTDGDIQAGKDYFTEMRSNLANLKTALACTP